MSPSLLQLQSLGIQDVFLTKDPQINVFKYSYYRHVNFATEISKLHLNESATFGKKTTCEIPKKGHLLSKLYLHLRLPALTKTSGEYACYSNNLGHAIFSDPIELEIGGVIIDKIYPQYLDIHNELTSSTKREGKNLMLMKSDISSATLYNATKPVELIIPLDFWFTKQYSSALPLLSMYSQDIRLHFKFRNMSDIIHFDGGTPPLNVSILDSNVYAEYIFLDETIAQSFQKQTHTYIIEQTQYNGDETIPINTSSYNSTLKFNHPVKELFFCCVEKTNRENNNYFVYSKENDLPIISEVALLIDGHKRFEYLPEVFYRTVYPDCVHSVIPLKYIYCMPFAIAPEDNQPTGSINMSTFNDVVLSLKLPSGNAESYLYVFAVSYNVLTIVEGRFSLEFAV